MEVIFFNVSVSIIEFKCNFSVVIEVVDGELVVVFVYNKFSVYLVFVEIYQCLMEWLEDLELVELV